MEAAPLAAATGSALAKAARYMLQPWRFLLVLAVLAVAVLVQREWRRDPVVDVATVWNQSIERLGFRPLFPPQEDFHVGDVFAVLRLAEGIERGQLSSRQAALIDKSVRIRHIDLSSEISRFYSERPAYRNSPRTRSEASSGPAVTSTATAGNPAAGPVSAEPPQDGPPMLLTPGGGGYALRSTVFPGIAMVVDQRLSFGGIVEWLAGTASRARAERISIGNPMTYGIDPASAAAHLVRFCNFSGTVPPGTVSPECTGGYLRYVMALQYGPALCERLAGKPIFDVQLFIVHRVYVSQNIDVTIAGEHSASAGAPPHQLASVVPAEGSSSRQGASRPGMVQHSSQFALAGAKDLRAPVAFGFQAAAIRAVSAAETEALACRNS